MSAPLFLVEPAHRPSFTLDGPEGHHAADVQRLRVGEAVILADGAGAARPRGHRGRPGQHRRRGRRATPAADPRLVVVQGIAKGDRGELAVQAMTEIGVDEIVPWAASRSVVQWRGDRGFKARDKWASTAREAAKQARRPWLPVVAGDPDCSTKQVAARLGRRGGRVRAARGGDRAAQHGRAARPARSCWWSAPRAASATRSWRRSSRPAPAGAARPRGPAHLHRGGGRAGGALRPPGPLVTGRGPGG